MIAVTSMSQKLHDRYGYRCIETFEEFWPREVELVVNYEDESFQPKVNSDRIRYVPLLKDDAAAIRFFERHKDNAAARGSVPMGQGDKGGDYTFRLDCIRFAYKVFSICQALSREKMTFWIDADVYTHAAVDVEALRPSRKYIACLQRPRRSTETGFIAFDPANHIEKNREFVSTYRRFYEKDEVFDLDEWHDGFVFDRVLEKLNIRPQNWARFRRGRNVFHKTKLARYMTHLKGRLKPDDAGHGHSMDKPAPRTSP
jgi:hypothetical protein